MPSYLVEVYLPRSLRAGACTTGRRARAAAEALSREGQSIRYIRTMFLPEDETCFHVFEAASPAVVEEAVSRAALGHARVVTAVDVSEVGGRRAT